MHFLYLNHLQNRNLRKNLVLLNNLIQIGQIKKLNIKEAQTGLPCCHMLPRCHRRQHIIWLDLKHRGFSVKAFNYWETIDGQEQAA